MPLEEVFSQEEGTSDQSGLAGRGQGRRVWGQRRQAKGSTERGRVTRQAAVLPLPSQSPDSGCEGPCRGQLA